MNQWPQYVIEAVQGVVRPTLRRTVGAGEVACALNLLRTTEATANDIALACGMNVPQLKMRLAREGIKPRVRVRGGARPEPLRLVAGARRRGPPGRHPAPVPGGGPPGRDRERKPATGEKPWKNQ